MGKLKVKFTVIDQYVNEDKRAVVTKLEDPVGDTYIGKAVCSPTDTFDILTGKKISFYRAKRALLLDWKNAIKGKISTLEDTIEHLQKQAVACSEVAEECSSKIKDLIDTEIL